MKKSLIALAALAAASASAAMGRLDVSTSSFGSNDNGIAGARLPQIGTDINMAAVGGGVASGIGNDTFFSSEHGGGSGGISHGLAKHFGTVSDGALGSMAAYSGIAAAGAGKIGGLGAS